MNAAIQFYSQLAYQAMLQEVNLTPKPGLVDRQSNGAHKDMSLRHFYASAKAIEPYFAPFIRAGAASCDAPTDRTLSVIRPIGIECERAMLEATGGVNTHKGSIFSLGLVCAAIGRLMALEQTVSPDAVCGYVSQFCAGLVERELRQRNSKTTAGQRLFIEHGLTGARGEAESGFKTVLTVSLPVYLSVLQDKKCDESALHQALLHLMAINDDTNVVSRGGPDGLTWLQSQAMRCLALGGVEHPDHIEFMRRFDAECIDKNLSPGGGADLLILTWFFGQIVIRPTPTFDKKV